MDQVKKVEKEEVYVSLKQATCQIQKFIEKTNMDDNDDRKRTKNYYDWINKKTQIISEEKHFNPNDEKYNNIKRGSVIWVEFGFNVGAEFGGKHPAIVLRRTGSSIFVLPLSSQRPNKIKPYHVKVEKVYGFKNLIRWTNVLKLKNISLQRVDIDASIGNVKGDVLNEINEAIKQTHIF